ncbi:alpha/beta hydrolase [Dactylosporangium sp. NPDC050588]|uniref:alpha/beta hydrolase n=1 Tax=Dactylosporangium sp. NPDC050588 TaxID=3157211 RepID=UPI0033EB20AE
MDSSRLLVDAIALAWPELLALPDLGPDGVAALESALLPALRELESTGTVEAEYTVEDAFASWPAAWARVRQLAAVLLEADLTRGPGIPGAVAHERYVEVPVHYATDRAATGRTEPERRFGGDRGELSFGVACVSIPDDHRMGGLEKPQLWRLQFRPDPAKHVVLLGVDPLDRAAFTVRTSAAIAGGDLLLFVHGYNVAFADAARRAAQIAYDLNFPGVPMLYSWPSRAQLHAYVADQNNADETAGHFADFLDLALTGVGAGRVHAIAHSMGNRVLTDGLATLGPDAARHLGQVAFAAPDVDASSFTQQAARFAGRATGYTLYASSNDEALRASQMVQGYPRAGQAGPDILVVDGVDTIDASLLETGLMGHAYFGDRTSVLSDLFDLIRHGHPPAERFGLRGRKNRAGRDYWLFSALAN